MNVFNHAEFAGHEQVIYCHDASVHLHAIIAIHDSTLGPAVGGCRLFPYPSEDAALNDVLRLSRGMTYKSALAGLPFGGAKSVIIAEPARKTPALLKAFAQAVERLDGRYWTGEDVNIGTTDVEVLASHTHYVMGRVAGVSQSGDPSPFTAAGVFAGMRAALMQAFGSPELANRRVAVQGIGNVGSALARLVIDAGGSLVVADSRLEAAERARRDLGAMVTEPDAIYDEDCDVFAPCAMGATLNESTVPRLRAKVVCGAANNQLASPAVGKMLVDREIVYAPDYVVNAGGMLNASGDFFGRYDAEAVWPRVRGIEQTTRKVLAIAAAERRPPHEVADELARAVVEGHRGKATTAASPPSPRR